MEQEIEQIIKDYFQLPGEEFIKKYKVDSETYWNGDNGEGLIQALAMLDGSQLQEKVREKAPILEEIKADLRANLSDLILNRRTISICVKPLLEAQRDADHKYYTSLLPHPELTEVEKQHISFALHKIYDDDWCVCCDEIVIKLGLNESDQRQLKGEE